MKKLFAIVLAVCLITNATVPVLADDNIEATETVQYIDTTIVTDITEQEANLYTKYAASINSPTMLSASSETLTKDTILSCCEISDSTADEDVTKFTMANVEAVFPECKDLKNIVQMGSLLYVEYVSKDNAEVIAAYSENGFDHMVIYNEDIDTAVFISEYENVKYENFRNNIVFVEEPAETERINFETDDFDNAMASPRDISDRVSNFESEEELLGDLMDHFPTIEDTITYTRVSSELSTSVPVKVRTFRGNYEIIDFNYREFIVGKMISVVAAYLGVAGDVAQFVVEVLGGLVSDAGELLTEVVLYNRVDVDYTYSKIGLVYDSTMYDDYVYVVRHTGHGEYSGGYDSEGEWRWIGANSSSVENDNITNADVADEAIDDYDWDLALNGYCASFNTVGFW